MTFKKSSQRHREVLQHPQGKNTVSVARGVLQDQRTSIIDAEEVREEHPCTHCCAITLNLLFSCCNITKERKEPAFSFFFRFLYAF